MARSRTRSSGLCKSCTLWMSSIGILALLIRCGEGNVCYARQDHNGTITFYSNETGAEPVHYNWQTNGIVQANEISLNNATIESYGPSYVTFKKCYDNVSFWSSFTGETINCPYNCSTELLPGVPPTSHNKVADAIWSTLSVVAITVIIVCCFIIFIKKQELQICDSRHARHGIQDV